MRRAFGSHKAAFLERHGDWWYSGPENRLVLTSGDEVAAYCSVMPARVLLGEQILDGLWWTDLVVAPRYRGRGLQTRFDEEVRRRSDLLLGFPNALAARIHRKHAWGVREDLRTMLLPLVPSAIAAGRRARGWRGLVLRVGAWGMAPFAAHRRRWLRDYEPRCARTVEEPDLETWSRLGPQIPEIATTLRDTDHLRRRYLEAPYRSELLFYEAGGVALVSRRLRRQGRLEQRILDLFGHLDDTDAVRDLLALVLRDATGAGVVQVTALAGPPDLVGTFASAGFRLRTTARFCWSSPDAEIMRGFENARLHWCLGDSDHDEP